MRRSKTSRELVLVKLGGSLLTDKQRAATARRPVIERLAQELARGRERMGEGLLVGHGSGSFGHVAAAHHGLGEGLRSGQASGASATQDAAAQLHRLVVSALLAAGAAPWSFAPSSVLVAQRGKPVAGPLEPLVAALGLGLVPVTYGDVVMDRELGASICSTEAVLAFLIARLRRRGFSVQRLLWLGETEGIYDREGRTVPRIEPGGLRRVRRLIHAPRGTDVTGGMLLRLRTAQKLARAGVSSWIVNGMTPGLLEAGLAGEEIPGTVVVARP